MNGLNAKNANGEESMHEKLEKFLMFTLGTEGYGIPVLKVKEIIRMQQITPIPQMPEYVRGVINLRGKVVPMIDLRLKFGLGQGETTERTCNIVVEVEGEDKSITLVGLTVDGVDEVVNIGSSQIDDKPDLGMEVKDEYIKGIAKFGDKVKTLLDIDKVVLEDRTKLKMAS